MDATSVLDILVPVVFVVVGLALIWLLVELVKTVKVARKTVEGVKEQITPTLDNVQKITTDIQPAISKVDPLVERVSLTVDAANLELMRVDSILEDVNGVTGTLANTTAAIDNVTSAPVNMVNTMTERVRGALRGRRSSTVSADLAQAAAQAQIEADDSAEPAPVLTDQDISQAMESLGSAAADQALADTAAPAQEEGGYYTYDADGAEDLAEAAETATGQGEPAAEE